MNRLAPPLACALVCSSFALSTPQEGALELAAQEAEAFVHHYVETLEGKDEEAIRALFAADERMAWYSDGELSYSNADEVLAGMQRFAGIEFSTTVEDLRVVALTRDLASVATRFQTVLTIPGSEDYRYGGVITWLLERDGDGTWRLLLGHTSTPGGRPADDEE